MVATAGAPLLRSDAIRALTQRLFSRATLITPNRDEAALLLGRRIQDVDDLRQAAQALHGRYGCAVLLKGGHLRGLKSAVDFFHDRSTELLLEAPLVRGVSTHGTGCTTAAAVTAYLALGRTLSRAVTLAKSYVTRAIANSTRVAGHDVLGFFFKV
jgi:hydroxymethylpyrimidine/phosphomethylpyrimidine kinase